MLKKSLLSNGRLFTSNFKRAQSTAPYNIDMINDDKVVLATINMNKANFFDTRSLSDWNHLLNDIETNKSYYRKPIIFSSPEESSCFSAGMDLKTVAKITDTSETKQLFEQFEDTMARIATLKNRTIANIHGHAIAGGFFVGLCCDARFGLNDDKIGIGMTEIDVGIPFPSLMYRLIQTRLSQQFAFKLLLSQPSKLFTPKQMFDEGYFTEIASNKEDLMNVCLSEANRIHCDSMEAYLSVKEYLWQKNVMKQWNDEKEECMNEFARVRNTDDCQRRMDGMLNRLKSKKV